VPICFFRSSSAFINRSFSGVIPDALEAIDAGTDFVLAAPDTCRIGGMGGIEAFSGIGGGGGTAVLTVTFGSAG